MPDPAETNPPTTVNATDRNRNEQPYLGGADSVDKTSYRGNAHSAEADDAAVGDPRVTAAVPSGGGMGLLGWITLGLAVVALAAYGIGLFR
ncbi:MAG TPA: hypothetical protein VM076_01360 [Gemmatimonadaceae bacterium]|nr:hypothetical protein [Gemmatimonadaceae bacterium]